VTASPFSSFHFLLLLSDVSHTPYCSTGTMLSDELRRRKSALLCMLELQIKFKNLMPVAGVVWKYVRSACLPSLLSLQSPDGNKRVQPNDNPPEEGRKRTS
jgi:hypothetical protein